MAIATLDALVAAMAASTAQKRSQILDNTNGSGQFGFQDQWTAPNLWSKDAPTYPTGAGALCDNTTAGAMPLTDPGGGNQLYLARADIASYLGGAALLYDRLWHVGGLDASLTTEQVIGGATWSRVVDDAEVWMVAQAASNFVAPTITLKYTNQAGTANQTATTLTPNFALHQQWQMWPLNLASGDYGVQKVQSVQLSSGGNAVNFALVALKRLALLPIPTAGAGSQSDAFQLALPRVATAACLAYMLYNNGGSSSIADMHLAIVEG